MNDEGTTGGSSPPMGETPVGPTGPVATEAEGSGSPPPPTNDGEHKLLAILGYIFPILFFVPLLSDAKHNAFAKFHANQQLNLLLFWVVGHVLAGVTTFILLGFLLYPLVMLGGIVFLIMGVINAANGVQKELPVIGRWRLLK